MTRNDFQYGGWNSYTLQCGTIMTLISPGVCTLQCGMWLWNRDSEFTKWNVIRGSKMICHWIRPSVCHIGILHPVSISTTLLQLTCHSAPVSEILSNSDHRRQKKITSCRFWRWRISAMLDFMGPIMGSLKSPCTTSYRSSIETITLNCFVFEKIAFFCIFGDRQTKEQTNRWTAPTH